MTDAPKPAASLPSQGRSKRTTRATVSGSGLPLMDTVGRTGLNISGGFLNEEFLPALKGPRAARVYREMADNESTVGAFVFAITSLLGGAKWNVQAADDSPEGIRGKELVEEAMGDMAHSWADMIAEVCTQFVYGFAPMEITWKRRQGLKPGQPRVSSRYSDGIVAPAAVELRAQGSIPRWDVDEVTGEILGLWQQPISGPQVYIPAEKLLLFRTQKDKNNPEGRSLLRSAYRAWYYKKRLEEIEAIGVERDLAGLPVVKIPARYFAQNADPADKALFQAWQRLVTTIRRDKQEGIVIPSDRDPGGNPLFELELLNSGGSRTFDTTKIIDRYSRAMAMSVLADFIFLGQQSVGSFALSSDKTALFAAALGCFRDGIVEILNRDLIGRLWEYNAFPDEYRPTLSMGDLEHPNLAEVAAYITALSGAGMPLFPDVELENHLRDIAGLPAAPEERDELMAYNMPAPGTQGQEDMAAAMAEREAALAEQEE